MMLVRQVFTVATALLVAGSAPAQTIRLDESTGAVFDGILDGFPGLGPQDGVPDFGGNQLGVGLRTGATEERGVAEYPTGPLAGVAAAQIEKATLTFNIDDVLATFGPGTEFSGFAAEEIIVHVFDGDGDVDVADFSEVSRSGHLIDTTIYGPINDTSLGASGPLFFQVDITADVKDVVRAGAAGIGIGWRTMDPPTGTSLDNLGNGSAGPPGVGGSVMPYLEIERGESATPTVVPATEVPTSTSMPTATEIPTATATWTSPPTSTPSPTRPAGSCIGDCDRDARVVIAELIMAVNIALGQADLEACTIADFDENGRVSINELIQAVTAALGGCE